MDRAKDADEKVTAARKEALVTAYQLAWNLDKNIGSVKIWVAGRETSHERDVDAADFVAIALLLQSPSGVAVGKTMDGDSYMVVGRTKTM